LEKNPTIDTFPSNPSYYSPAYFRIFYLYTHDARWFQLLDTTYEMLSILSKDLAGSAGVGLIPDWVRVDKEDSYYPLEGKNSGFGWEATRVPLRVALDYYWFDNEKAKSYFNLGLPQFIEHEWEKNRAVFCDDQYDGHIEKRYEAPLFLCFLLFGRIHLRIKGLAIPAKKTGTFGLLQLMLLEQYF